MKIQLGWSALEWPSCENVLVEVDTERVVVEGFIVAVVEGEPVSLRYGLNCDPDWTTRRLDVEWFGRDEVLSLVADGQGAWLDRDGRTLSALERCVDVDISVTPFTNTLPIRRLGLRSGESRDLRVVYVEVVPGLPVSAADQRYTCLKTTEQGGLYRYESGDFQRDLRVDSNGFVVDYPQLWTRTH